MPNPPDPRRILLADDEATFRQATAELFRERGYSCDEAADAQEAAAQLRVRSYDVAILDVRMPGNTDLELLDLLATLEDSPLVILITGYPTLLSGWADERRTEAAKKPSVAAYLIKPFRFEELLRHVEQIIAQQNRR